MRGSHTPTHPIHPTSGAMRMQVTRRLCVLRTSFGQGTFDLRLQSHLVDERGEIVGRDDIESISDQEDALTKLGVDHGRTDGEWGNREVERFIREAKTIDDPGRPSQPAVPEIREGGRVIREGLPAVEGKDPTYKLRFGTVETISFL